MSLPARYEAPWRMGKKKNTVSDIAGNRDVPSRVQVSGMFPYIAKRLKRGMFEWSL